MPEALTDVGGDVCGEKEPDALGFLSMRDPKGLEAKCPPVEPCEALDSQTPIWQKIRFGLDGSRL